MFRLLLAALLLQALPLFAGSPASGAICDRNGIVLLRIDYSGEKPTREYPFGALATHVLTGLNDDVLPRAGETLTLTIDARIQSVVEEEMWEVGRGAAVVIDPANGNILAMASVPSFDPSKPRNPENEGGMLSPGLNRAIAGFAPGATFLPVTALAGAAVGKHLETFPCKGGVQMGSKFMKCHIFGSGEHGDLDVTNAIKLSCGPFFYQYGNAAGIAAIHRMGEWLGLGQKTGIPLRGNQAGILPNDVWLREKYPKEKWSNGYTANTSIGQGFVLATPLQMAMVATAIGNGGYSYAPRLIAETANRVKVQPSLRANLLQDGVSPEGMEMVRKGMLERSRLTRHPRLETGELAGCPGTSQAWTTKGEKDNTSWFIGFTPYEKPRFAICALVQGAKRGSIPAALSAKILNRVFAGKLPEPTALEPNRGHKEHLDSLSD